MKTSRSQNDRINLAIDQIKSDMRAGTVPESTNNFQDLHKYVDANKYGGFLEDDYIASKDFTFENEIQAAINEWLFHEDLLTKFCRCRTLKCWENIMIEFMSRLKPGMFRADHIAGFNFLNIAEPPIKRVEEIWYLMNRERNNAL